MLKKGLRGAARAHQPEATGSPAQAVVGAQGGPAGGQPGHTSLRGLGVVPRRWRCSRRACGGQPGHTSLRGRGVLPMRWSVLKEGPRGTAWAHLPEEMGSPAQSVVGAQGGPPGRSPGTLA